MRMQSAIEFLTTYGFLIVVLTIAIIIIVFIVSATTSYVPSSQCTAYSNINCNFVSDYVNTTVPHSLITFQFTNSQASPITINSFSMSAGNGGTIYTGYCYPLFLYPGEGTTCIVNVSYSNSYATALTTGFIQAGEFTINAQLCNDAVGSLPAGNCTANVIYSGTYSTPTTKQPAAILSVLVAQGPTSNQLQQYSSVQPPFLPSGYTMAQNGEWEIDTQDGDIAYDYASNAYLPGSDAHVSMKRSAFPVTTTYLGDAVSGTSPYNSLLSMAYTVIYEPNNFVWYCTGANYYSFEGLKASASADDDLQIYYKAANAATWNSLFSEASWSLVTSPQTYGSTKATLSPGYYDVAVVWTNANAQALQAVNISLYTVNYAGDNC